MDLFRQRAEVGQLREARDAERKRADSLALAYREQQGENDTLRAAHTALVTEVERLREMLLNAGWPREAEELAALALRYERAAVVAWLREEAEPSPQSFTVRGKEWAKRMDDLADAIERGEHRPKEKP